MPNSIIRNWEMIVEMMMIVADKLGMAVVLMMAGLL